MSVDPCPICGKPYAEFEAPTQYLPFCSARCKNADLGKWLTGNYSVGRPLNEGEVWSEPESTNDN